MAFPKDIRALEKDFENLNSHNFKWLDIEIEEIKARGNFVNQFNQVIDPIYSNILNTLPFEQLFPLKFIDLITDYPEYTFGQPIYNESLNFFTFLIDYFIRFYLLKDLQTFDKIDSEYIEFYTPLARDFIFKKNQENRKFMDKYFNQNFNLHKFAVKLVEKFVVGCTWRWIGGSHKAHIYSVQICKILMEYGLLNDDQMDELKTMLYSKIQTYRTLEDIVDKDSKTIDKFWVDIWIQGLKDVRESYCSILVLIIYRKQDVELLTMLKRFYKESKGDDKDNKALLAKKLENVIKFNKSILFEEEFGKKLLDFLLRYILSQNKVGGEVLTTKKIESISDNFLHIFSNIEDPYLYSIKMIREQDYQVYMQEEASLSANPLNEPIFSASISIAKILNNITYGNFLYNTEEIVLEVEKIFDNLNQALDFEIEVKSFDFGKKNQNSAQRILLNSNLMINLLNLVCLLDFQSIQKVEIMQKFSLLFQYFLLNNTENHCIFLSFQYLFLIFDSLYLSFPFDTLEMFSDVFSKYSGVMLMKEFLLEEFLTKFETDHDKFNNPDGYAMISKLIDILANFINIKGNKIFTYIPEYDIRIAESLTTKEQFFKYEELEVLLKDPQDNENKLILFMNALSLIQTSTAFRFTELVYKFLNDFLPMEDLKILIQLCQKNLNYRSILFDLYANIHVDYKNHLLDGRVNHYHTKPADMQYEEDPYVDKNYDFTVNFFKEEIEFLLEHWQNYSSNPDFNEQNFLKYANCSVFSAIMKLVSYFMVIKEEDLGKLNKYIDCLEEFQNFLMDKKKEFFKMYTLKEQDLDSPMKKELEIQLSRTSEKKKIDKLRIVGYCKVIFETCQKIISFVPSSGETKRQIRKLISSKTLIEKTSKALIKSQNFSNRLQIRKENLQQMTIKEKSSKSHEKFKVIISVAKFYEKYKMTKMSVDGEKNIYIASLSDTSPEMTTLTYNLCSFIYNQISRNWELAYKNQQYNLIACLCNSLFISTSSIQKNLYQVIMDSGNNIFLDNVWTEMKNNFLYLKFKTSIDKFWNETFTKTIMLLQFHQFLCEDNNTEFKEMFGNQILPNDTIDRVQRWTTIFQKLCENCDWHKNYEPNEICEYQRSNRPHLIPLATKTFDNLAELCTGPCLKNQKKIYTYIYDKYNGVLQRYWRDPDTEYYKMKLALIEFIGTMSEGLDPDVVNYQTTNFDLKKINTIMINSLKQLYYCKGLKQKFTGKFINEYELKMSDFDKLIHYFETNMEFSRHTLLAICIKLFSYIKMFTSAKSSYAIFCKEREDLIAIYEKKKTLVYKSITEEELLTYKFLNKICIKVEVLYGGNLINYYFQTLAKTFYLSQASKQNFLNDADRSSGETKVSYLLSSIKYFEIEMDHNENKYKNFYVFYRVFSSKTVYILELLCLLICLAINGILLTSFHDMAGLDAGYLYTITALGTFEIIVSVISVLSWSFLNYNLIRKINREKYKAKYAWKEEMKIWDNIITDVWQSFLTQKLVVVFLFHIIMTFLGLNASYAFFGIDLFTVVSLFPMMQYIIKSVTEHGSQLISTLILAAIIMFAYGLFVHIYFIDSLSPDFRENCSSSLAECYFLVINKAFRNGEGIGGLLDIPFFGTGGGDGLYYGILILNLSFFLLINTVFLNIILAVLVDTFSELRGKSDEYSKKIFSN